MAFVACTAIRGNCDADGLTLRPAVSVGKIPERTDPMRVPDYLRGSTFRLTATFAVIFSASAALLFAFIYWQTALSETKRIDRFIVDDVHILASEPRQAMVRTVSIRLLGDLHRLTFAGLFNSAGVRIAGNLAALPPDLPADGRAHRVQAARLMEDSVSLEAVRAAAIRLDNGDVVVIGRAIEELDNLRNVVLRALELGVVPATVLAVAAGAFVSRRAELRVKAVHRSAERILSGDLRERLPTLGTTDDFDRLAQSVNRMLDEIGRLLDTVKGAGDDIAHDLRTPLARLRTRLERAIHSASSRDELEGLVETAIRDLDQALSVIATLLRMGEIEAGRQRAGFQRVDLSALVEEVAQIYQPVAEEKELSFACRVTPGLAVLGDRGLLMEAVANLVQNAIKFTPAGGGIWLDAAIRGDNQTVRVTDNGPGIPEESRSRVFDRFYRLDRSRTIEGTGLGLSLVAAIMRLHQFEITLSDAAPGCIFEIVCPLP